jgi:tRNA pseudouridine38-40 synthase
MAIGAGKEPVTWAQQVLESRDRRLGGVTAPPDGLYLKSIEYPEHFGIPSQGGPDWPVML